MSGARVAKHDGGGEGDTFYTQAGETRLVHVHGTLLALLDTGMYMTREL